MQLAVAILGCLFCAVYVPAMILYGMTKKYR